MLKRSDGRIIESYLRRSYFIVVLGAALVASVVAQNSSATDVTHDISGHASGDDAYTADTARVLSITVVMPFSK